MSEKNRLHREDECTEFDETRDENRDPITGAPGSHPVGVAVGGTAVGAAAAAVGAVVGGPVGAVVGGTIGAVAGGLTGKSVAESIDPTAEDKYWRKNFKTRPYYSPGKRYYDFGTAYRYGYESAARPEYLSRTFEEIESELETGWPSYSGTEKTWNEIREATRDAYNRIRDRYGDNK